MDADVRSLCLEIWKIGRKYVNLRHNYANLLIYGFDFK